MHASHKGVQPCSLSQCTYSAMKLANYRDHSTHTTLYPVATATATTPALAENLRFTPCSHKPYRFFHRSSTALLWQRPLGQPACINASMQPQPACAPLRQKTCAPCATLDRAVIRCPLHAWGKPAARNGILICQVATAARSLRPAIPAHARRDFACVDGGRGCGAAQHAETGRQVSTMSAL
jgi:hypothetical protein